MSEQEPIYQYVKGVGWVPTVTRPKPLNYDTICNACGDRYGSHSAGSVNRCPDRYGFSQNSVWA